jgi:hypothetical protein
MSAFKMLPSSGWTDFLRAEAKEKPLGDKKHESPRPAVKRQG